MSRSSFFIKTKHRSYAIISSFIMLISTGTVFYHYKENWPWVDSFYFSVTSLTTTGYGDFHPSYSTTRLFTSFYLIIGVGIAVYTLNILAKYTIDRRMSKDTKIIKK